MFSITKPSVIWFSGGRCSGYLLWKILEANNGALPDLAKVVFANTGKEDTETLDFVRRCSEKWGVKVVWLEYRSQESWAEVDWQTASRDGKPFDALIADFGRTPHRLSRFCVRHLKFRPIHQYLKSLGWDAWDSLLGLRAEDGIRLAKMRALNGVEHFDETLVAPLSADGIRLKEVKAFWDSHRFNHPLPIVGTKPALDNCDLCFLKSPSKIMMSIASDQSRADWWVSHGFRGAYFSHRQLRDMPSEKRVQPPLGTDGVLECGCPC